MIRTIALLAVIGWGCVDQPVPIAPPGSTTTVNRLSQLGIFHGNLAQQIPVAGFVPYDVNVTLYSDSAHKYRFMHLPPGTKLGMTADRWDVPVGTMFVKTFYFPVDARDATLGERLIETRFLVREASGYRASTYLWNDAQTDAIASGGNLDVPTNWIDESGVARSDYFHVPGTSQCVSCHQDRALGIRSRQMDHAEPYGDGTTNQLEHLVAIGALDTVPTTRQPLSDPFGSGTLDQRARSYLDANCSHCHAQQGLAASTLLYWDMEHTDSASLPLCRATESVNGRNRIIVPGHPEQSEFLARMVSPDAFARMPQGPTHDPDGAGIAVLQAWVSAMAPAGCP